MLRRLQGNDALAEARVRGPKNRKLCPELGHGPERVFHDVRLLDLLTRSVTGVGARDPVPFTHLERAVFVASRSPHQVRRTRRQDLSLFAPPQRREDVIRPFESGQTGLVNVSVHRLEPRQLQHPAARAAQ
jgi:hypothetical protein